MLSLAGLTFKYHLSEQGRGTQKLTAIGPTNDTLVISVRFNYICMGRVMMFKATFNNISVISWLSVLLLEETGENHVASHWQTLWHNVVYMYDIVIDRTYNNV